MQHWGNNTGLNGFSDSGMQAVAPMESQSERLAGARAEEFGCLNHLSRAWHGEGGCHLVIPGLNQGGNAKGRHDRHPVFSRVDAHSDGGGAP